MYIKATRLFVFNQTNVVVAFSRVLKGTDIVSFFIPLVFIYIIIPVSATSQLAGMHSGTSVTNAFKVL